MTHIYAEKFSLKKRGHLLKRTFTIAIYPERAEKLFALFPAL